MNAPSDQRLSPHSASASLRPVTLLAGLSVAMAIGWLVLRVFIRLDFTDEMQYYGQISGLVRTGKFFHDDLFLQQLGYLFLLPFFKLHAVAFPDQSYLILFGRFVLMAAYLGTGALFWRCASLAGNFTRASKLGALALLLAWTPLQLFAPSYNSLAYLVIVAVVSVWLIRDQLRPGRYLIALGAFLPALVLIHPTSGAGLSLLLLIETWGRHDRRCALQLGAAIAAGGAVLGSVLLLVHGLDFPARFSLALRFTSAFAGAAMVRFHHLPAYGMLLVIALVAILRIQRPQLLSLPAALRARWAKALLALLIVGSAIDLSQVDRPWNYEFFKAALVGLVGTLLLALAGPSPSSQSNSAGAHISHWFSIGIALIAGVLFLFLAEYWTTGYFASCLFIGITWTLPFAAPTETQRRTELLLLGVFIGSIFAFTSGNGLLNFGYGIAAVLPFLALEAAVDAEPKTSVRGRFLFRDVMPAAACLLVVNGWLWPYRDQPGINRLERVDDVPAFRGIWMSSVKRAAIRTFQRLPGDDSLVGKRLLVAGPQPWLYFLHHRSVPCTPMVFMHLVDGEKAEPIIAAELFSHGEPDALIITNPVPAPVHAKLQEWIAAGCVARQIGLSEEFRRIFRTQAPYFIAPEVLLLTRPIKTQP